MANSSLRRGKKFVTNPVNTSLKYYTMNKPETSNQNSQSYQSHLILSVSFAGRAVKKGRRSSAFVLNGSDVLVSSSRCKNMLNTGLNDAC